MSCSQPATRRNSVYILVNMAGRSPYDWPVRALLRVISLSIVSRFISLPAFIEQFALAKDKTVASDVS
jgi:hypothetical protein